MHKEPPASQPQLLGLENRQWLAEGGSGYGGAGGHKSVFYAYAFANSACFKFLFALTFPHAL